MTTLWRCFPWDASALPGAPFSPLYLAPGQSTGRFDLADQPAVLYLAGSPAQAVGEVLQGFRGVTLTKAHLRRHSWPLALVTVEIPPHVWDGLADLGDPETLRRLGRRPEELAHHDRLITQAVARQVHAAGHAGFRWWSALTGAWQSTVLFHDRVPDDQLGLGTPVELTLQMPAVVDAARVPGIGL